MVPYDSSPAALLHPGRAETWFAGGVPGDVESLACEASRLAYLPVEDSDAERVRLGAALALAGFGEPTPFDHPESHGQGYAALRGDGLALVAFRGTEADCIRDLATDARVFLRPWELGQGKVHSGFAASALGLWPDVNAWLEGPGVNRRRLLICGHSLGGAMATLLALPSGADELVTLGCPRVGNRDFAGAVRSSPGLVVRRIVNCCDGVTEAPPEWFGFEHAGSPVYIDRLGAVHLQPRAEFIRADRIQARLRYPIEHPFHTGAVPARDLADHAPVNYLRAFWR
ncbi:MAG: lipase family protein [Verrucomicrobiales bacterium]|nr:lipase family protein [Verrucomicrobiales bacterium]